MQNSGLSALVSITLCSLSTCVYMYLGLYFLACRSYVFYLDILLNVANECCASHESLCSSCILIHYNNSRKTLTYCSSSQPISGTETYEVFYGADDGRD